MLDSAHGPYRGGSPAGPSTGRWPARGLRRACRYSSRAVSRPHNVGEAVATVRPLGGRRRLGRGARGPQGPATWSAPSSGAARSAGGADVSGHGAALPDAEGRFGDFGGRYIPETLMPAIADLESAYRQRGGRRLLPAGAGRSPRELCRAPHTPDPRVRISPRQLGPRIYLKREDLLHTGAHKINAVLAPGVAGARDGEASHRRRDRRRPARRRHGHRLRAARPGVRRLHGRGGCAQAVAQRLPDEAPRRRGPSRGGSGSRTLKDAINEAIRGLGDQRCEHPLPVGERRGTASLPGDGARLPGRHRARGEGAAARDRGPPAHGRRRLRRRRLQRHRALPRLPGRPPCASSAWRPPGEGLDGRHAATLSAGCARGAARRAAPTSCRIPTARSSRRTRSRRASTTRAWGRSTPGSSWRSARSTSR